MDDADWAQALSDGWLEGRLRLAQSPAPRRAGTGICRGCGEPIDPRRLAVMPHAERCVPCQEALER